MNWPWVSRARLEAVERELERSEAERKRFLDRLLPEEPQKPAEPAQSQLEAKNESTGPTVIPFTTAFDRVHSRTAKALKDGKIDGRFKARVI